MARAKKEKLSLEELLEQALVKEEDQPYEVPSNWVWTTLKHSIELISGRDVKSDLCNEQGIGIPYILGASNLQGDIFEVERWIEKPQVVSIKDDILLSVKGTIGKVYLQLENEINISRQIMALRSLPIVDNKYLKNFLEHMSDRLKESGNGLIPGISREVILSTNFPLPPLAEQQRIVERIESLFEKLDTAKELAQNALDSFENRKAAILHKAFTGELTAKWREENGVSLDSWEEKKLIDISDLITKGASPRWQGVEYTDDKSQTLFVTSENVREGYISLEKEKYLDNKINNIQQRSMLKKGDVLLNIVGASIGRSAIFEVDKIANINQAVSLIRLKECINREFICHYLNSPKAKEYYTTNKVDVARANLSLKDVGNICLSIPSRNEQNRVVEILENILGKEQQAQELCDVIEKIDLMKKAILARAFRGELGTNNPEEESGIELLKGVLKEKL